MSFKDSNVFGVDRHLKWCKGLRDRNTLGECMTSEFQHTQRKIMWREFHQTPVTCVM